MASLGRAARRRFVQRRKALGFTQESLAAKLDVERSTVVRWESGRSEPLAALWPKLAAALKVAPEQLIDLFSTVPSEASFVAPSEPVDERSSSASRCGSPGDEIAQLRRILMGRCPDAPPSTHIELAGEVDLAWNLFFSARLGGMRRMLPTALARAYNAAETATGERRQHLNIQLAQLLHASSNFLGYVSETDLATVALVRADALVADSGDELTRASIKGSQSWLFAKNGMYRDATECASEAATEIEPRLSAASPRRIAIWGELLCYAAFAASRAGEHAEARRYLRLTESAGIQLGNEYIGRPEHSNMFGPTSAASFGVINETAADRPAAALELATAAIGGTGVPPTLRSRRLVNVAHAQIRSGDDVGAVSTLRHACSIAPEFVGHISLAHMLTDELLSRRSRRPSGLTDLADRLGSSIDS